MTLSQHGFLEIVRANPGNVLILERLPALGLQDCHLTAGCLFQTVWNVRSGRPADWGIRDYDVLYFDDRDLSWEAEDEVIRAAGPLFANTGLKVEIRNQARVHLWYEQRFGFPYAPLTSTREGIDRFLIACTCLGISASTGELYAPNGVQDVWDGVLRINPVNPNPDRFIEKARDYQKRWPWLQIIE